MAGNTEKRAARVTLLDAVDLDVETHRVLKEQLSKATKYLSASLITNWEAEIDAILRYGIWRLSVCRHQATFGQQLVRVKYGNSFTKRKAQLLIILSVGCMYVKEKISQLSSRTDSSRFQLQLVKKILSAVEVTVLMASVINLIVFLRNGNYPTLIDRILNLKPVSAATPGTSRVVGYQYMTRELLWHGFIELITFTIPLINYQSFKRKITGWFYKKKTAKQFLSRSSYLLNTKCAVCNDVPVLPHHIGCSHTFCYYCLESNRLADKNFECPLCGTPAQQVFSLILSENSRLVEL